MDRCLAQPDCDLGEQGGDGGSRRLDLPNPFFAFDDASLARICLARADALESLSWATEAERVALRVGTALLLDAVARRLGGTASVPAREPVAVRFRLDDMIPGSAHGPFLAAYQRGQEEAKGKGPFGRQA